MIDLPPYLGSVHTLIMVPLHDPRQLELTGKPHHSCAVADAGPSSIIVTYQGELQILD